MALYKKHGHKDIFDLLEDFNVMPILYNQSDLATDIYENNGNIIIKMQMPGIDIDKVDISVEDTIVTVTGIREEEKETETKNFYKKEIRTGEFTRSFSLPHKVAHDKAQAKCVNGVLTITLPKITNEEKTKKIKISK